METAIKALTAALETIKAGGGTEWLSSLAVEAIVEQDKTTRVRYVYWSGRQHYYSDTLEECVSGALEVVGKNGKLRQAEELRQQAQKLEIEAARLEKEFEQQGAV